MDECSEENGDNDVDLAAASSGCEQKEKNERSATFVFVVAAPAQ